MQSLSRTFFPRHALALLSSALVLALAMLAGEFVLKAQLKERASQRLVEALSQATQLRVHLERELNALLSLNNGLAAYLVVRNQTMDRREVQAILDELFHNSHHVRNFGVAVGFRLQFVYPIKGNERAIGLDYRNVPAQWPAIERITSSGKAILAGPVNLVQGGRGLIYRMPIMIKGRYWGLLSTVIDIDSLMKAVERDTADPRFEFAIRGRDALGVGGGLVWGELSLYDRPDTLVQELEVPGGYWAIGVRHLVVDDTLALSWTLRGLAGAFGLLLAALLFLLVRNRGLMARRAMYDGLTDLPNRRLFEDRALMAFSRQQRQPGQLCALLFLDLDDFKAINDEHGHKAGDAVLLAVAERALAAVRQNDTVARWGGDEFIVLLENVAAERLDQIARRLRQTIEEPVLYQGRALRVGVSIGQALHPDQGMDLDALLHAADSHMYSDKTQRKSGASGPAALAE